MQPQHKVYVEADMVTLERVYVGGKGDEKEEALRSESRSKDRFSSD